MRENKKNLGKIVGKTIFVTVTFLCHLFGMVYYMTHLLG